MSDQASVIDQMLAFGLEMPDLPLRLNTAKPVRFGPKKKHWYWLREQRLDGGRFVVLGRFGDWALGSAQVEVDWRGISADEQLRLREERRLAREADAAREARKHARAALGAKARWQAALRDGRSDYLARKLVDAEGCRFEEGGRLLIPLLRYDLPREQALVGLQVIEPDGTKRFTAGFAKRGAALRLGLVDEAAPILVCEGYATGLTLRMATGKRVPVFVALDAGNLSHVVAVVRSLHARCPILICADDDWQTDGNPGRKYAKAIVKDVPDCHMVYPVFGFEVERGPKDSDFNDLHARQGLNAVARQLHGPVAYLTAQGVRNAA